tara:strand:- start:726 stop:866 length:141 start_codon:yes stop_codon:yes gene_type:complete
MDKIERQAIIGLCGIALQHMMDENYDKAQDTIRGMMMSIEGSRGEA